MKKMSHIVAIIIFLAAIPLLAQDGNSIQQKIRNAFSKGDASGLATYFSSTIDINIPGKEGTFSATQAELMMKEFFKNNKATGFKDNHSGVSKQESKYVIGSLQTEKGNYRVYYLLKKDGGNFLVHLLQISSE